MKILKIDFKSKYFAFIEKIASMYNQNDAKSAGLLVSVIKTRNTGAFEVVLPPQAFEQKLNQNITKF